FGGERLALRVEHAQEVAEPAFEPLPRESCRLRALVGRALERRFAALCIAVVHERILRFLQGVQHRCLVASERNVRLCAGDADAGTPAPITERCPRDARSYGIRLRGGAPKIVPRTRVVARRSDECDTRKQVRYLNADSRGRCSEIAFGDANVGPAAK